MTQLLTGLDPGDGPGQEPGHTSSRAAAPLCAASTGVSPPVFPAASHPFLPHGFLPLGFSPSPLSTLDLDFQEGSVFRATPLLLHPTDEADSGPAAKQGLLTVLVTFFSHSSTAARLGAHTTRPAY